MNKLIFDDKERVNQWIYKRIGRQYPLAPAYAYNAFGVEDETGQLIGGVAFDGFSQGARCSMHCAGESANWCSRRLIKACFDYVFNVAGCKVVVNAVAADNEKSINFTQHVGFTEMTRIKDGAGNCDLVILALHRNECRWI